MLPDVKDLVDELSPNTLRCSWPEVISEKRRNFSREAENQPYLDWLQAVSSSNDFEDEDEDTDDYSDEDPDDAGEREDDNVSKDVIDRSSRSNVRLFMEGMLGDEADLPFSDQVKLVASFCEQPDLEASKPRISGEIGKPVALIDDRSAGSTLLRKRCRPYLGPLTSTQVQKELQKEVNDS